jgi:hypothetical protein
MALRDRLVQQGQLDLKDGLALKGGLEHKVLVLRVLREILGLKGGRVQE